MADGGDQSRPAVTGSAMRAAAAMHACKIHLPRCPCDGVAAEILRVVYNLQPVAFPEGQIGRCPRLVVVQRHKRCHASCSKRKRRGKKKQP